MQILNGIIGFMWVLMAHEWHGNGKEFSSLTEVRGRASHRSLQRKTIKFPSGDYYSEKDSWPIFIYFSLIISRNYKPKRQVK